MINLYVISFFAVHTFNSFWGSSRTFAYRTHKYYAHSANEALGYAHSQKYNVYPQGCGYSEHECEVTEISDDDIKQLGDYRAKDKAVKQ